MADGTVVPVPHSELNVTSLTLSLSVEQSSSSAPWTATVTTEAVRECGGLVSVAWQPCSTLPLQLVSSEAPMTLELPEAVAVSITTCSGSCDSYSQALAPEDDVATMSGLS